MSNDDLGDRMKSYEAVETERRFLPLLPVYARIDGRGFSRLTKDMTRPYDERMSAAMIQTTKYLVEETKALIGYTQSDEISLVWYEPDYKSDIMFNRKIHKLTSVLSGLATAGFWSAVQDNFMDYSKYLARMPHFDSRVISLPTQMEAANMFLWRELDAFKNSVSMAAHTYFSHKSLQGVGSSEMQERLFQEKQINFNNYPSFFKRGSFVRRVKFEREFTEKELAKIPEGKRPEPGTKFIRQEIREIPVPPFSKVANRVGFIFNNEEPRIVGETENELFG